MLKEGRRVFYLRQNFGFPAAGDQLQGKFSFRRKDGFQKHGFPGSAVEQIVAQTVNDGNSLIIFKALQHMRMASYDQIRSRVYISLSQDTLVLFRRFISFDSPMYKYNDMIIPGVGFRDPLVQKRRIIGLEQSGLRVGGIPFVCRGDSGRAQKSKVCP